MLFDRVAGRWPVACSPSGSIGSMCRRGIRVAGGHLRDGAGTAMRTLLSGLDFPLTCMAGAACHEWFSMKTDDSLHADKSFSTCRKDFLYL